MEKWLEEILDNRPGRLICWKAKPEIIEVLASQKFKGFSIIKPNEDEKRLIQSKGKFFPVILKKDKFPLLSLFYVHLSQSDWVAFTNSRNSTSVDFDYNFGPICKELSRAIGNNVLYYYELDGEGNVSVYSYQNGNLTSDFLMDHHSYEQYNNPTSFKDRIREFEHLISLTAKKTDYNVVFLDAKTENIKKCIEKVIFTNKLNILFSLLPVILILIGVFLVAFLKK